MQKAFIEHAVVRAAAGTRRVARERAVSERGGVGRAAGACRRVVAKRAVVERSKTSAAAARSSEVACQNAVGHDSAAPFTVNSSTTLPGLITRSLRGAVGERKTRKYRTVGEIDAPHRRTA